MERHLKAILKGARKSALLGLAVGALAVGGVVAHAQTVEDNLDDTPSATLDLPKNFKVFGNSDPHLRTATALVNGSVITGTDVDQRLALVILANGGKASNEELERLRLQVLRNLIDEALQIQEAAANDVKVEKGEVDQSFARVAGNFKQTPEAFTQYLRSKGSSAASLKRQIEAELAWSRVLRRKVQPFVNVSSEEVNSIIDRIKESKGAEEFHIAEIYLSATPENQQQIIDNAHNIMEQIQKGGSFAAYAREFSEASTAAVGGDLGWVRPAQLPEQLVTAAQGMQPGQLAGPIPLPGGFSILYLADKRKVLGADPRDAVLSLKQVGINFPAGTNQAQARTLADKFAEQTKAIQGCGAVDAVAKQLGADVVANDGVKVKDLPAQLQQILLGLQIGQATPPFGTVSEGVRVLVLCGRDDPQEGNLPSFEQVQSQMEEERVNKRARIYLRDLRRDAIIEYN